MSFFEKYILFRSKAREATFVGKFSLLPVLIFFLSLIGLSSCNREQMDDCYARIGAQTMEVRLASAFHTVQMYDNVNLVLMPGAQPELKVKAGEKIMDAIKTEIHDSILVIHNTLKCNWVRSYDREITVYATAPALREIRYESSGDLTTNGKLAFDSLQISVWGGAGSLHVDVDANRLNLAQHYGTVDFHVKGTSKITTIFSNSYGPFYCDELVSDIVYIRNSGSNNCYVHAKFILEAEITSVGDIYFSGNPPELKSSISGSGKLVKVD